MKLDPPATNVSLWLKVLHREQLHNEGWIEINRRFHGIARAARVYIQANFPDGADQEAAFDGFTLALLAVARFEDIEELGWLYKEQPAAADTARKALPTRT